MDSSEGTLESYLSNRRSARIKLVERASSNIVDWLADQDVEPTYIGRTIPFIRATIPQELLESPFFSSGVVESIQMVEDPGTLLVYAGWHSMDAPAVSGNYCFGTCDDGYRMAIWEDGGLDFHYAKLGTHHQRFPDISATYYHTCSTAADCELSLTAACENGVCVEQCSTVADCGGPFSGYTCYAGDCIAEHSSFVAAAMGVRLSYTQYGTNFPQVGLASHENLYYASDSSTVGLDWALTNNVYYANRSMNMLGDQESSLARAIDWAVRFEGAKITLAAGNTPSQDSDCRSLNAICVGSYHYNTWWSPNDDVVSSFSSWINPSNVNDIERPHMVAPGSALSMPDVDDTTSTSDMTTSGANGLPISGTSFAAPSVNSLMQQLQQWGGAFDALFYHEVQKAVLMAASVDANADGSVGTSTTWSGTADAKDGAGRPSIDNIQDILESERYARISLTTGSMSSCGADCLQKLVATVTVPSSKGLRAALAYNSCVGQLNEFRNDVDLRIQQSTWVYPTVRQSTSLFSDVEVVDISSMWAANRTFNIYLRVKGSTIQGCGSGSSEPVGVAWRFTPDSSPVEN